MAKKIMTLDDLYMFFVQQNKSFNFNSKESGSPIIVTTNGLFATEEDNDMPGMLKLKLKVCHTETNRNGSHISKENMENAMPTLKYRPILAYIHELPDGSKDFYAHNVEFVEDENGEMMYSEIELYRIDMLYPLKPLIVTLSFKDEYTVYGVSYVDESGSVRSFALEESKDDGSLLLNEF